jgi:hypothetical protein
VTPRAVVTITSIHSKDPKDKKPEIHTLSIGKEIPGTDTVAARVKGENRTVFLRSSLATDLLKPVDDFKSKKIFAGSIADVGQLSILRGRGRIDFEKRKETWWMARPVTDLAASAPVTRLIDDLLAANVTEFLKIPKADLGGDGLAPPIYTVTMTAVDDDGLAPRSALPSPVEVSEPPSIAPVIEATPASARMVGDAATVGDVGTVVDGGRMTPG